MGKWTSEYYDDVLGAKIKSLVSGAVNRSKLEKSEPSISYEAFIEDLDPGDSFTTTLTELLVREMAERRHRQIAADRRLISDRTAKGLRTLAAPQRVYRDRGVRGLASRRSLNLTDYLVVPPEEMELDDDNDSLESAVEGARINYDLYDAYTNPTGLSTTEPHLSPPPPPPHLRHVLRSTRRESWGTLRDASPDAWGPPPPAAIATAVPSAPPLTRQPSIRRVPARSRTVDFTDFTSRRRSFGREGNNSATVPGDAEADESAPQTSASPFPPLNAMGMPPRRFFPSRRSELPWSLLPEGTSANSGPSTGTALVTGTNAGTGTGTATGAGAMPSTRSSPAPVPATASAAAPATASHSQQQQADAPRDQRTFLSWLPSSALLPLPPPPPTDPRTSPRSTPRLRRGGVRPPESLMPLPRPRVTLLRTESPEPLGVEGGGVAPMAVSAPAPASFDPRLGLSSPAPAE